MRFDHFTGNEVSFIFTCIALGVVPLICIGIGYFLVQKRKKMGLLFDPSEKTQDKLALFKYAANGTIHPVSDLSVQKADGKVQKLSFPGMLFWKNLINHHF